MTFRNGGRRIMDDTNETGETLTVPRTTEKAVFVIALLLGGFLFTAALRRGPILGAAGVTIAVILCCLAGLIGLLSREVCVFTSHPRSMRIEGWFAGIRVRTKPVDISSVSWVRSRGTAQGASVELGIGEQTWNTIEVQTTYLTRQQYAFALAEQAARLDEIRASIARVLGIKDAGWEKSPAQRSVAQ
jgi:hypothetical protein